MRQKKELTHSRLLEVLLYEPETGLFKRRLDARCGNGRVCLPYGQVTGWKQKHSNGAFSICVSVDNRRHLAHRLAWFYVHKRWPKHHIDHINNDPLDNRICNLREATPIQNGGNTRRHKSNKSGFKGVDWHKANKRWRASIRIDGRKVHLGLFDTKEKAAIAYAVAATRHHGEFAKFDAVEGPSNDR